MLIFQNFTIKVIRYIRKICSHYLTSILAKKKSILHSMIILYNKKLIINHFQFILFETNIFSGEIGLHRGHS